MPKPETITPLQTSQALLDANGNFSAAAAALGLSTERLHELVNADTALRLRWKDAPKAPPSTSIINRPDDVAIAEAMAREEKKLKEGVDGLGLSPRARDLAIACQKFQRHNFSQVIQITGGGITKAFLEALEEVEKINHRLENLDVKEEQVVAYESILREDRGRLLDFIHKAAVKVDQSVLIQAKIQKMLGDGNSKGNADKPGFSPLKRANVIESKP